ncbi:DUF2809 domain-containing protein [candidate division KSB1 bacterium]|nr:DUF2809 domain-containing protein [candidate division KSB1 bacterium]RQW04827.1 MAG: DUF2809 domain-containing protein [candidate division KSB1 bacterium]
MTPTKTGVNQLFIILTLFFLIPLGLATKFYHGPAKNWVTLYAGDIFYPMFWFFLGMLLFPAAHPLKMSLIVWLFSTAIEFTQLYDAPLLTALRRSFVGRTLVGTSFVPLDILYYFIGCLLALLLYYALHFFRLPVTSTKPESQNKAF